MEKNDISQIRRPILYRSNEDYIKQLKDFHLVEKCSHCNEIILDGKNNPLFTNEFIASLNNMRKNVAKTEYFQHEYEDIQKRLVSILEFCQDKRKEQPRNSEWAELHSLILNGK